MKRIILVTLFSLGLNAKGPLLTDPILKRVDGIRGVYDGHKVSKSLWLITEIKAIHNGIIKVDANGAPSIHKKSIPSTLIFRGEKHTVKELINLENKRDSLTSKEKEELEVLFQKVKIYFGLCHDVLLADARGAEYMIIHLIKDFCKKYNRPNSLLLHWEEGKEAAMYEEDVINFTSFYMLTFDLNDFLSVLISSCPKAKADYINLYKKKS